MKMTNFIYSKDQGIKWNDDSIISKEERWTKRKLKGAFIRSRTTLMTYSRLKDLRNTVTLKGIQHVLSDLLRKN